MSIIQASFPENIYFSSQEKHTELCDFVFSIHINAKLKEKKDKDQSEENLPIVYIGGLSKLFPKVEENPENQIPKFKSRLENFIDDLRVIGNDNNWSIKYNDKYDLLKLKCKTEHSFTDKYTVGFELPQECEFSKKLVNNEPIPLDVTFQHFDSIFDGLADETVASYTIYAKEVPYVEEFYAYLGSEENKVKTVTYGERVEIKWSVRNNPKTSAFLCDESGAVICDNDKKPVISPYNVQINEDRRFKLFVEKDGRTISQTLSIKAAYVIKNTDDWNAFATTVDNGDTYLDKLVILDKEITVSQKIGDLNRGCFFSGTFDGNGNTITANIKDESKSGMSLFHIIQNATIKNLTVKGSITGGIHSAGLVGYSRGAVNKILNCIVTATIKGEEHIGGILGHGDAVIDNCVFKGKLLGGSKATGVFLGWGYDGGAKSVTNSLYIFQNDQEKQNLDLVQLNDGSVCVGNCYKTENIGTYGTLAYLTEQPDFSTIEKTAVDGTKFYIPGLPSGNGTEADPYAINNKNDWNSFANLVSKKIINGGKTYEGEYVKLNADITVSQKVGNSDMDIFFSGTFDGDGHTITAEIEDTTMQATALFRNIKGATIKNLTVAGSITGGWHAAGVVGCSMGSGNKIENCIVTATINGDSYIGGILGHGKDSSITIDNCVFKGLFNDDDITKGVFLGWGDNGGIKNVTNCLYIMRNDPQKTTDKFDLARMCDDCAVSVTDCYKTENIGTYGTLAYLEERTGDGFIEMTAVDGTKFYVQAFASGCGTEADPYIINNEQNWNIFANSVSFGGKTYEGEYVKLGADITVSEKIGDFDREKFFAGTFDGNGLTITANMEDPNTRAMAVFSYIKGATIKNLTVAGSITGERHTAGVVGRSMGSGNKISNCIVTATIKGNPYIGGILGHGKDSDITIDNCVFKGKFLGGSDIIGVFVGYSDDGTKTVTNCLYIMQNEPNSKCLDLANKKIGNMFVTDCYKTENIGTYGTLVYLEERSGDGFIEMTVVDGTKFYVQAFASGSGTETDPYIINNEQNWNIFANSVSFGEKNYEGEYVKLGANITVSEKIGDFDREKFFAGTFDGNGLTITANITDESYSGTALFQYIQSATIKNLTVAGEITGGMHAAGVVEYLEGCLRIENCIVTALIYGRETIGGILGHGRNSDITIDNCVFKGWFYGGSTAIGVFLGRSICCKTIVTNCLYIMQNEPKTENLDLVQVYDSSVSVTDCYKTENIGTYGTLVYLEERSGDGFIEMTAVDGTKFYVQAFASGNGTKADPYIINNEQNWNIFANSVSFGGKTYEGEYIKLNDKITVSQKIGDMNSMKFFSGTFDGNGLTITADITDESNSGTALFQYIQSATIKNLTVAGKITGGMHAAGLVGRSTGSGNKIEKCIVTATINGGTHIGGILGHGRNSDITIDNCVFKGTFNGGSTAIGVFFGWGDEGGTKNVRNCLYIKLNDPKSQSYDIVNMDAGSVSVTDCYKTENIGTYGTLAYLEERSGDGYIEMTAVDGTKFYVQAFASGSGTEADPYIINNEQNWNSFANSVSFGEKNYKGEYVKLGADITVSEKIGDFDRKKFFAGTFDGNGLTVTANLNDPNTPYMAVFSYIEMYPTIMYPTIENLTVAGKITGREYTAGLVGYLRGCPWIKNCVVTATINGKETIGGILGEGCISSITIDNCVFKGLLNGDDDVDMYAIGVFLGRGICCKTIVTNCLYIMQNEPKTENLDLVQVYDSSVSVTDCYKTENIGTYGIRAYLTKPSSDRYIEITAIDGTKFYVLDLPSGSGTEADPYIINNENDWNSFANLVSKVDWKGGKTYEGEYVKLNADITVSQTIGDYDTGMFFAGTFDGDGHTITAKMEDTNTMAVFSYINGATIKNLTVAGKITGGIHTAGVVGYSLGSGNKIENCIVTATINGGTEIGGILGCAKEYSNITIDNCVFKGLLKLKRSRNTYQQKGVFVCECYGVEKLSVKNCLYIKQEDQDLEGLDLANKKPGSMSVTDCYKTEDIGTYGTLVYLEKPSSGNYIEKTAIDGTIFYVPA